ncbi:MAG TPA: precorrin-6A synthase (deacetylating) [Edaphobacter sp.]|nr:precorrin-6A synthase (deacetylating) [Edaphobacter sp.]
MRKLYIIGIGAGDPEQVTVQAIRAMNAVDVFFFMNKGDAKTDLVRLRKEICERYIDQRSYRVVEVDDPERDPSIASYTARVQAWHQQRVLIYEELIERELGEEDCGAVLVWGDPSLYDSTLRIIEQVVERSKVIFEYEVVPGITSVQALAARHKIVLNGIGESVCITTGRQLAASGFPGDMDNVVVMLDGNNSFKDLVEQDVKIYWGAYVGTEKEILLSGKLRDLAETIESTRDEARGRNGWIMDIYLLKRSGS